MRISVPFTHLLCECQHTPQRTPWRRSWRANVSVQSPKPWVKYTVFRTPPRLLRFLRISRSCCQAYSAALANIGYTQPTTSRQTMRIPGIATSVAFVRISGSDPSYRANPNSCHTRPSMRITVQAQPTSVRVCECQVKLCSPPSVCANVRVQGSAMLGLCDFQHELPYMAIFP